MTTRQQLAARQRQTSTNINNSKAESFVVPLSSLLPASPLLPHTRIHTNMKSEPTTQAESLCVCIPCEPVTLVGIHDVPPFLKAPDIHTGYRAYLSYGEVARTLCVVSNEFVNVWTHLGGFLVCMLWFGWDAVNFFPVKGSWFDFNIFLSYIFCVEVREIRSSSLYVLSGIPFVSLLVVVLAVCLILLLFSLAVCVSVCLPVCVCLFVFVEMSIPLFSCYVK